MIKDPISSDDLIKYIHNLMEKGKQSQLKGWTLKDILEDIYECWGQGAWDFSYKYIIEDYCSIKENS